MVRREPREGWGQPVGCGEEVGPIPRAVETTEGRKEMRDLSGVSG